MQAQSQYPLNSLLDVSESFSLCSGMCFCIISWKHPSKVINNNNNNSNNNNNNNKPNPYGRTMALGLTQPLTAMSTRNL
jgi:hypothetical protein